jgi:hypothetical protein
VREWRNRGGRYFAIGCCVAITGSLFLTWYQLKDPMTGAILKKDAWQGLDKLDVEVLVLAVAIGLLTAASFRTDAAATRPAIPLLAAVVMTASILYRFVDPPHFTHLNTYRLGVTREVGIYVCLVLSLATVGGLIWASAGPPRREPSARPPL